MKKTARPGLSVRPDRMGPTELGAPEAIRKCRISRKQLSGMVWRCSKICLEMAIDLEEVFREGADRWDWLAYPWTSEQTTKSACTAKVGQILQAT